MIFIRRTLLQTCCNKQVSRNCRMRSLFRCEISAFLSCSSMAVYCFSKEWMSKRIFALLIAYLLGVYKGRLSDEKGLEQRSQSLYNGNLTLLFSSQLGEGLGTKRSQPLEDLEDFVHCSPKSQPYGEQCVGLTIYIFRSLAQCVIFRVWLAHSVSILFLPCVSSAQPCRGL